MVHWRQLPDGRWEYLGGDGNWYSSVAVLSHAAAPPQPALQVPRRPTVVVPTNVTACLLGLASAALLIAGALLPWINVAGLGDATLNLFQLGPEDSFSKYGTVLVLMGVVVALIGAARFVMSTLWISVSSVGLGIGAIAIAFDRYRLLRTTLAQHPEAHNLVGVSIGYGVWIVIAGGVTAIVSGFVRERK